MQEHLKLLGWKVKDVVTGFTGVVEHVGLDLYGCVQVIVRPEVVAEKTGAQKLEGGLWFDASRLKKIGAKPVMHPIPMKDVVTPRGERAVSGAAMDKPVR